MTDLRDLSESPRGTPLKRPSHGFAAGPSPCAGDAHFSGGDTVSDCKLPLDTR